jgi:hemolysin D
MAFTDLLPDPLRRSWTVARESLALEKSRPPTPKRSRAETEFLPAALEVMESPPSPLGRAVAVTLMLLLVVAVLWAIVGRVDVVAVAIGKIVPSGRTKVIQPLEIGVIRGLYVTDGQRVKAGQLLIQLDQTSAGADTEHMASDLVATQTEIARLRAAGTGAEFRAPPGASKEIVAANTALLESQKHEQEARIAALDSEIRRKASEQAASRAAIVKLEKILVYSRERLQVRRDYYEQGFFPRLQLLDIEEQVIAQEQELAAERHREQEAIDAQKSLQKQRAQAEAEYRKTVFGQLADSEKRASGVEQDLIKAEQREKAQRLVSPIDGTVQQLAVHTVGGVVSPAQPLMAIVPDDDVLEVEGRLLNSDVGFVKAGQRVEVKLDAFPFTKYGTLPGVLQSVSADSVQDEKLGLVYPIRVKLDRNRVDVDGQPVTLAPGMATTVEIKTGSRRLIEFVLSPVMRLHQESMRER